MAHIPTQESTIEKIYRIAEQLGIGLEEAVVTYAGFDMAFSDEVTRRQIFGMIDQLDESAAKKGEPLGLMVNYAVELSRDGIRVGRYADEIPPGEVVHHVPTDRARIMLHVKDNFPTQEFLGPLIVNRPEMESIPEVVATGDFSDNRKSNGIRKSQIANPKSFCLGPFRLTFNERFPIVSAAATRPRRITGAMPFLSSARVTAPNPHHELPPWAARQAGAPAFRSGLSPPRAIGESGHSASKAVPPAPGI